MLTVLTGAWAGFLHVLAGPDHLAAVGPIAIEGRRRGWIAGWSWGLGHASGVVAVAVLAIVLRDLLPPIDAISAWSERVVGVALIGVGFWALRRSGRIRTGRHLHGNAPHDHLHLQAGPAWLRRIGHAHASFALGVLHGMAGSSHFVGVLPALALPTRADAFWYVGAFGAGTVAAMTIFAAVAGGVGGRVSRESRGHHAVMTAASVAAILIGGVWLFG